MSESFERRVRGRSLWLDLLPGSIAPRAALAGDRDADIAVVGGGFSGLWTAYWLLRADPALRVVVLEGETCGFGASGRNAGFVSAGIAGQARVYERSHGLDGVRRGERAMIEGIDVIGKVVAEEGIECGWLKGGSLRVATTAPQLARVRAGLETKRCHGLTEDDVRELGAAEIRARVAVAGVVGGTFTPHCARVSPAALARGLADAVERRGGVIHEQTSVSRIEPGRVVTAHGAVRAPVALRTTEAFTVRLPGAGRTFLPLASHMLATEPLPPATWDELGWEGCETLADQHHHFVYGQRTFDGRIALGGRGLGYRFASGIREDDPGAGSIHARVEAALRRLFPAAAGAAITHRWAGVFAAPRDWSMGVGLDRATGLGWAGGYSGHGVVASSLGGRTLADLVLGRESDLVTLPWVGHTSPRWEVEPLRWLGANGVSAVLASADGAEDRTGRAARRSKLVARFAPGR
ncbi:MAG: FAD-binding oxidoreductase [Gaiellales bacterium]